MSSIDHRRFKEELYGDLARVGSAVSNAKRLEMLELLAQRERSVEDLANELGLSVANASKHLKVLAAVHLLEARRARTFTHYRLASPKALRLLRLIGEFAEERLPEVAATLKRHLGDRAVEQLQPENLARRIRRGAVLLDVRPEAEYFAGHIKGARNIPIDLISRRKANQALPKGHEVIVYCRGPYCVWADEAVEILRKWGFTAHRLLIGAPDMTALGERLDTAG
jgi:rhodanese-related sulfurtransferase/DNA-binding transcriptional ArsR family regulator